MRRWADAERARDAAALLPLAAAILFLPPFILLFAVPVRVGGIPLIVVYTFVVWAAVVFAAWLLADNPGWGRREIDAAIAKGERLDVRLAHKVPVAWVYLTGWITRDQTIHFRDDVYGRDEKPTLVADARPQIASAARASGFVLQSAVTQSPPPRPVSYLDSQ